MSAGSSAANPDQSAPLVAGPDLASARSNDATARPPRASSPTADTPALPTTSRAALPVKTLLASALVLAVAFALAQVIQSYLSPDASPSLTAAPKPTEPSTGAASDVVGEAAFARGSQAQDALTNDMTNTPRERAARLRVAVRPQILAAGPITAFGSDTYVVSVDGTDLTIPAPTQASWNPTSSKGLFGYETTVERGNGLGVRVAVSHVPMPESIPDDPSDRPDGPLTCTSMEMTEAPDGSCTSSEPASGMPAATKCVTDGYLVACVTVKSTDAAVLSEGKTAFFKPLAIQN